MRITFLCVLLTLTASLATAEIYRWVDKKGTVHFSDKPVSKEAEVIRVPRTGIQVEGLPEKPLVESSPSDPVPQARPESSQADQPRPISEEDYRISSNVGKVGADVISISGRISAGPRCDELVVTATAVNDNGLRATITDRVKKPNSFGSTLFAGKTKVYGSAEDRGFWKIESVKISCYR